jgi:hypothetical protein
LPIYFKVLMNGQEAINMVSRKVKISANIALINELVKILSIDNIRIKIKQTGKKQIKNKQYVH